MISHGDCLEVLRGMDADSVDSMVTDPPYGWRFMGKAWDVFDIEKMGKQATVGQKWTIRPNGKPRSPRKKTVEAAGSYDQSLKGNLAFQAWTTQWTREVYRVLKPGAHILVFCGPRTYHRMASGVEDAGFEIRDQMQWLFGSGFPKSLDISKAIDKAAGAEREVVGKTHCGLHHRGGVNSFTDDNWKAENRDGDFVKVTAPSTPEAIRWQGFGTALKPANEPILLARKPLSEKTVAANVLKHGVGGINVDGCRIGVALGIQGRFPANLLFSHNEDCVERCAVRMLDEQSGVLKGGARKHHTKGFDFYSEKKSDKFVATCEGSSGGASRFFFQVKHDSTSLCNHTFANFVRTSFKTILPTLDLIVPLNAEGEPEDLLVQNVKYAVRQCDTCTIRIAQDLVAIKNSVFKTAASQACLDFIGSSNGCILTHNLAFIVEQWESTGIIPTIQSLSILFGCVSHVIDESTKPVNQGISGNIDNVPTRFLYCPKCSKSERNAGCEGLESNLRLGASVANHHPTVKPLRLMRYLIRLVTPPGGIVLDPFMGSGSTGVAALQEGFQFIGIEKEQEYVAIAEKRIEATCVS